MEGTLGASLVQGAEVVREPWAGTKGLLRMVGTLERAPMGGARLGAEACALSRACLGAESRRGREGGEPDGPCEGWFLWDARSRAWSGSKALKGMGAESRSTCEFGAGEPEVVGARAPIGGRRRGKSWEEGVGSWS